MGARASAGAAATCATCRSTHRRDGGPCLCIDCGIFGAYAANVFHVGRHCGSTLDWPWIIGLTRSGMGAAGGVVARPVGRTCTRFLAFVRLRGDDFLRLRTSNRASRYGCKRSEHADRGHPGTIARHAGVVSGSLHYFANCERVRYPVGQFDRCADHAGGCVVAVRFYFAVCAPGDVVVLHGARIFKRTSQCGMAVTRASPMDGSVGHDRCGVVAAAARRHSAMGGRGCDVADVHGSAAFAESG